MGEKTYVLVIDEYSPDSYPKKYSWKWVPFKWTKLEHLYRCLCFNAFRQESDLKNVIDPVEWD